MIFYTNNNNLKKIIKRLLPVPLDFHHVALDNVLYVLDENNFHVGNHDHNDWTPFDQMFQD